MFVNCLLTVNLYVNFLIVIGPLCFQNIIKIEILCLHESLFFQLCCKKNLEFELIIPLKLKLV